jgi:hypothetical protein
VQPPCQRAHRVTLPRPLGDHRRRSSPWV